MSTNITFHTHTITKKERQDKNNHKSFILWFTGLSGSGKSTLTTALDEVLFEKGINTYVLDGDNIRHGLNKNLGFSAQDREENIRRIGEVSKLFVDAGVVVSTAFISPYQKDRDQVRSIMQDEEFIEVFVDCPLDICESRDPKGLYKKARAGEIKQFTGIDDPYEAPQNPELVVKTGEFDLQTCVSQIVTFLEENKYI